MLKAELVTRTKFLCGCSVQEDACPYCLGLPGALPLPNRAVVEAGLKAARALGCAVAERIDFLRALDDKAPRALRVATTDIGAGGELDGKTVPRVWIEENRKGMAMLCVQCDAGAEALDGALKRAGVMAKSAARVEADDGAWHPIPDQPGILVEGS